MFRFFVCINLILAHVSCQSTENIFELNTDFPTTQLWQGETSEQFSESISDYDTTQSWEELTTGEALETSANYNSTQSWEQLTTEDPLTVSANDDSTQSWAQSTIGELFETSTNVDTTQTWKELTTEETSEQENYTTTQQTTCTTATTSSTPCPPSITPEILEEAKKEIIDTILRNISLEITSKLEAIEAHLSTLTCSNNNSSSSVKIDWQIYENLQIPLTGWLRVFDHPYSHNTRLDHLDQLTGLCHKEVLVAATYNESIVLAAVGPAKVLTLNTMWNQPQQFGQVYWYRSNGRSFGFSPSSTIRQTPGDNEDLNSPLRLSWFLDQNMGGYRAGVTRSIIDNPLWHKVIYCN